MKFVQVTKDVFVNVDKIVTLTFVQGDTYIRTLDGYLVLVPSLSPEEILERIKKVVG